MTDAARRFRRTSAVLFAVYSLFMLWLLFGQRIVLLPQNEDYLQHITARINLIPFRTIAEFAKASERGISSSHAFINLAGNVVMFIPLGAALPVIWTRFRGFWRCMGTALLLLLCIELLQLFSLLGSADIDDLILNLIGVCIGYGAFSVLKRFSPRLFT